MYQRIAVLFVAPALIATVHSEVLKCYMCTSFSNDGCEADTIGKSLQPVECTVTKMLEWQRSILQHEVLSKIAHLFEVDETLQDYRRLPQHLACAKMLFHLTKETTSVLDTNVTVRMCQAAKTEILDPCTVMNKKLKEGMLGTIKQCTLCTEDACNGATSLSSGIFYILLSFLGIFLHVALYHRA